jgi:hypothetical protein
VYGKIAALAAGARERFVEAYALMGNSDIEPPVLGAMFDSSSLTFADELAKRLERTAARRIVWHFERPTAWERWLADRLRAAGGELETFQTPLSPRDGMRITTPWERRDEAMAVIREIATGLDPTASTCRCFGLNPSASSVGFGTVFLLATDDTGLDGPPEWLLASWGDHRYGVQRFSAWPTPIGAQLVSTPDASRRVLLLGAHGELSSVDLPSLRTEVRPTVFRGLESGFDCAAHVDGHWWALEAFTGRLLSTHPAADAVPAGPWIGIAAGPANELVLASADQEILVYDLARKVEIARFPARVASAVRETIDECTPLAVGAGWIGIANLRTSVLSVYDRNGRDLGTARLDVHVPVSRGLSTIGGAGHYLGVASGSIVRTFEVRVDPACAAGELASR